MVPALATQSKHAIAQIARLAGSADLDIGQLASG
jgi:hypothetical protein